MNKPKKTSKKIFNFILKQKTYPQMSTSKRLILVALTAALANILSYPLIAIPLVIGPFESSIHFSQLPIILCGVIAGPTAGLMAGAIGGLFMGITKIPFIVGGVAILGWAAGVFGKRFKPLLTGLLAWGIQAPYVVVTDYVWFAYAMALPSAVAWGLVGALVVKLTVEAVIGSAVAEILIQRLPSLA